MSQRMVFNEQLTVADQPSQDELSALAGEGFKSVINIRHDGEDMMPMSPEEEGQVVKDAGMEYLHVPVSMKDADASLVDRVRAALESAAKPTFVHCKLGKRAGAMVMMDVAVKQGWTGEQALKQAEAMGFECDNEKLASFVSGYIDSQST